MYHGTLVCPHHVDLVFQCPLQVSLIFPPVLPMQSSSIVTEIPKGPPSKCSPTGDSSEQWKHVCQVRNWYLKYKDGLKSFASAAIFFISVLKKARSLLSIIPVQGQSKWKAVRTCGSNSVLLLSA